MKELLLHPAVKKQVDDFMAKPSHALMLIGQEGAGKQTLSRHLATGLLLLPNAAALVAYPYFFLLEPEDGVLKIAAIRKLQERMRLKTLGQAPIRRVIIIEAAHTLTVEAQNALLKLLEEPPADTVIIMNVVGSRSLLPTVYSRAQQLQLRPPVKALTVETFRAQGYGQSAIERAFAISSGQIGLLSALLKEDTSHSAAVAITEAKTLLKSSTYERMAQIDLWAKHKEQTPALMTALHRVARAALLQASSSSNVPHIRHWHRTLHSIHSAQVAARHNANAKLLFTDLLLNL